MRRSFTNDDFFRVIGQISVFFATLDFLSTLVIVQLVKPGVKRPDLTRATLGQKLSFIGDLKHNQVVNSEVLADIHAVLPESRRLSSERNRFIHDLWMFAPDLVQVGAIRRLTIDEVVPMRMSAKSLSIDELYSFLQNLEEQQRVFNTFADRLRTAGAQSG